MPPLDWPTFVQKALAAKSLSGEELKVLLGVAAEIDREGGPVERTQTEIGMKIGGMPQPTVSANVTSLVKKGFLTKDDPARGRHKVYGFGRKMNAVLVVNEESED